VSAIIAAPYQWVADSLREEFDRNENASVFGMFGQTLVEREIRKVLAPVKGFDIDRSGRADVATAAHIDKLSVLGEGCVIKPNARVVNSVLGPGVHLEEKASIENSVVWSHTRISGFAEIRDAVIGRSCHIGRNTAVGAGTVLGDKASLPDYSKV